MNKPIEASDPYYRTFFYEMQPTIAPKHATNPCQGKVDNCSSCLHSDLNNQNTKENEKQAKTHQCYSSEPVYSPQDKLLHRKFLFSTNVKKKGEKHRTKRCFTLPTFHRYQKIWEALLFNEERPIFEEQL